MENKQLALVTFEQAERLKKMGFDWPTELYYWKEERELGSDTFYGFQNWNSTDYRRTTSAPTVALALKWLRDVKAIAPWIKPMIDGTGKILSYRAYWRDDVETDCISKYDTYESAESALLDELLTLIEK